MRDTRLRVIALDGARSPRANARESTQEIPEEVAAFVPRRTNPKQETVTLLRRLLADEVDVMLRYQLDDLEAAIAFEVLGKSRPADVTWAEQMLKKHEGLPTDALYLVSWRAFS